MNEKKVKVIFDNIFKFDNFKVKHCNRVKKIHKIK